MDYDTPEEQTRRVEYAAKARHGKALTKEEYEAYHAEVSNGGGECNVWGKIIRPSKQEIHERMWDELPWLQQYRIPRTVAERLDLSANAKLVYGLLLHYPYGVIFYRYEIAGLCGLGEWQTSMALHDLETAGLLKIQLRWKPGGTRRAPSRYTPIQPPNRFKGKAKPGFLCNDITNFEEMVRERFNDIEP